MNEIHLPVAMPLLDQFLSPDRFHRGGVELVPDEPMQAMLVREAGNDVVLVFPCATDEIVGDADVERAVGTIRDDVDVELAVHGSKNAGKAELVYSDWAPGQRRDCGARGDEPQRPG